MSVREWDMEARWHGGMGESHRRSIKLFAETWSRFGEVDVKLGKERNRIQCKWRREKVENEARERMKSVASMLREEVGDQEGAVAMFEMAEASVRDKAMGLTLKEVEIAIEKEWTAKCAISLNTLLGPDSGLQVKTGK